MVILYIMWIEKSGANRDMQIILLPSKFLKEKEKRGNKLQKT
jgi:hypothetical protein